MSGWRLDIVRPGQGSRPGDVGFETTWFESEQAALVAEAQHKLGGGTFPRPSVVWFDAEMDAFPTPNNSSSDEEVA